MGCFASALREGAVFLRSVPILQKKPRGLFDIKENKKAVLYKCCIDFSL